MSGTRESEVMVFGVWVVHLEEYWVFWSGC